MYVVKICKKYWLKYSKMSINKKGMTNLITKLSIPFMLVVTIFIAKTHQVVPKILVVGDAAPNLNV